MAIRQQVAAKADLDGNIADKHVSFSDLKPRLNSDIFERWRHE